MECPTDFKCYVTEISSASRAYGGHSGQRDGLNGENHGKNSRSGKKIRSSSSKNSVTPRGRSAGAHVQKKFRPVAAQCPALPSAVHDPTFNTLAEPQIEEHSPLSTTIPLDDIYLPFLRCVEKIEVLLRSLRFPRDVFSRERKLQPSLMCSCRNGDIPSAPRRTEQHVNIS